MFPESNADWKAATRVKPHSSLAAWRRAMGFTQQEAARYLSISQSYYYKLESKAQTPRKGILKRLADRTGVPLDELMGIAA
jgi:transcriptional regulator with XRE-family HTH domain